MEIMCYLFDAKPKVPISDISLPDAISHFLVLDLLSRVPLIISKDHDVVLCHFSLIGIEPQHKVKHKVELYHIRLYCSFSQPGTNCIVYP